MKTAETAWWKLVINLKNIKRLKKVKKYVKLWHLLSILLYFNLLFQPSGNPVTATSRPPPFYPFPNIPDYFPTTILTTTLLPTSTTTQLPSTSTTAPATTTTSPLAASSQPPPTTFYPDPILPLRPVGEETSSGAVDLSTTSTITATTTTSTTTTSTKTSGTTTTSFPLSGQIEVFVAKYTMCWIF